MSARKRKHYVQVDLAELAKRREETARLRKEVRELEREKLTEPPRPFWDEDEDEDDKGGER